MVLVGNKSDLEDKRKVPKDLAQKKAEEWNIPFLECSAKTDQNISDIFHTLVQLCWDRGGGPPKPKSDKSKCNLL